MKTFNINSYIYIQITELGWKHLKLSVGDEYIKHCIKAYEKIINGEVWYRLQAHSVFELLPITDNSNILYHTNIMIDDESLEKLDSLPSLTKERVMKAIEDEPELPGVMPHKIYLSVKDDEMALTELLRITVRKTKQGIKDRVSSLCLEPSPIGKNQDELSDRREELKRFNGFMCSNQYDGRIPLIDTCIDDYLKAHPEPATQTTESGKTYHKVPFDLSVETWDKLTPVERLKFKGLIIEPAKVTDEMIEKEALKRFTSNTGWIDHEKMEGFKRGAKAMRDGKIG